MNLLFDTHTFIWWTCKPEMLPAKLILQLEDTAHTLFFSVASSWEVQIKIGIGKLSFKEGWASIVNREIETNGFQILPVMLEHTFRLKTLPPLHKDPFDRMLIAQALTEGYTIVTNDTFIRQYPDIDIIWD